MPMAIILCGAATHQRQGFWEQQPMAKEEEAEQKKALIRTTFRELLLQTTIRHVLFKEDLQKPNEISKEQHQQQRPQECQKCN